MIFYETDNVISQTVADAFRKDGVEVRHVRNFSYMSGRAILYGLLRGTGMAARWLKEAGVDYLYLDNGYFDAVYMDASKRKEMTGTYRICRNCLLEPFTGKPTFQAPHTRLKVLILPPTPYVAFMYDTTPEDWLQEWSRKLADLGCQFTIRDKTARGPFSEVAQGYDAVLAFNSIAAMEALRLGKIMYTTHGIIRNAHLLGSVIQRYDYDDLTEFYRGKQFTLEEIAEGKWRNILSL